jgi:DNA-binding MarR family transcriptional regulator
VKSSQPQIAARELLNVMMLAMRTVSAEMRRSRRPHAPSQMAGLAKISVGPCTLSDLARHQAVTLPTISKSVDVLVRRGWADRYDRRQTMVRLTPRGRRVLADIKQRAERHVAQKLAPLPPGERAQLVTTLRLLTKVLKAPADPGMCMAHATAMNGEPDGLQADS